MSKNKHVTASLGSQNLDAYLAKEKINASFWAALVAVHPSYVCHLRKGRRTPSVAVAARIETATRKVVTMEMWTLLLH